MELRTSGCDDQFTHLFESTAVAPTADGDVVLVTMADQGALRLDPASDRWERVAVAGVEPVSLAGPSWLRLLYALPLGLLVLAPVVGVVARRRRSGSRGMGLMVGTAIAGLSVLVFVVSLWLAARPAPPLPPPPVPPPPR